MKNKKAQGGMPINYITVMVIAVLVIAAVFYAAIRFELIDRMRGLPISEEEEYESVGEAEVAEDACPEEVGYFAFPQTEGYSTSYRYLHYMDGKILQIYKHEDKLWIHRRPGSWRSYPLVDKPLGSILDYGNQYLTFFCTADKIADDEDRANHLSQKDFDYFQGAFTIARFVKDGKQIICRNNETASKIKCLETS